MKCYVIFCDEFAEWVMPVGVQAKEAKAKLEALKAEAIRRNQCTEIAHWWLREVPYGG